MADSTEPGTMNRASPGRWPSGLAGMFVLALVAELALSGAVGLETPAMAFWRNDRRASAGEEVRTAEILCVGDSLVKTGVVPAALEARLDRPAYNLATVGNPTAATYFLLKRALDAGARPRALILDAQSDKLRERAFRPCVAAWAALIGPAEAFDLARSDADPGFFGLFLVHHLVPSIRLRLEIRGAIAGLLTGPPLHAPTDWPGVLARQVRRNAGAVLFPPLKPEGPADVNDRDVSPLAGPAASVSTATNLSYLERTLELARSRGIRVFLVLTPIHPAALKARDRSGADLAYLALLRSEAERYENVVVIDGRHVVEDGGVFLDSWQHMDVGGATHFSRALAEAIAPWFEGAAPGERWVSLPPFTEPAVRLAVETMNESEWAVAWQGRNP